MAESVNLGITGIQLNPNANLNSSILFNPGTYYYPNNDHTMTNAPTTGRCKIIVEQLGIAPVLRQTYIDGDTATPLSIYQRYVNTVTGIYGTWEKVITNTDVGTIASKDYEDGSFTPVIAGSTIAGTNTYSVQVGRYTKMGNRVFFDAHVALSAKDGAMSGNIYIFGLPFSVKSLTNYRIACSVYFANVDLDAERPYIEGIVLTGTNNIAIMKAGDNNTTINLTPAEITASTRFIISGSYEI